MLAACSRLLHNVLNSPMVRVKKNDTHLRKTTSVTVLLRHYKRSSGKSVSETAPFFRNLWGYEPSVLQKKPSNSWKKPFRFVVQLHCQCTFGKTLQTSVSFFNTYPSIRAATNLCWCCFVHDRHYDVNGCLSPRHLFITVYFLCCCQVGRLCQRLETQRRWNWGTVNSSRRSWSERTRWE